jgi:hypothetical protein
MRQRQLALVFRVSPKVVVHLRSQTGSLLTPVSQFYDRLRVVRGRTEPPDVVITVERRDGRYFIITPFTSYRLTPVRDALRVEYVDGGPAGDWREWEWAGSTSYLRMCDGIDEPDPTFSHVCGLVERVLLSTVCDFTEGLECFHAAAAARGDKCLLIVGESESGKTTTAIALCAQGWRILSDDTLFYDTSSGEAFPLDRRPAIRNRRMGDFDLYNYLDLTLCKHKRNRLRQSIKPEYRLSGQGAKVTDVLFLSGRGRDCRIAKFSPALGLLRLARASCARRPRPRQDLGRLATALDGVEWWECYLGSPEESARAITSTVWSGVPFPSDRRLGECGSVNRPDGGMETCQATV